MEMNVDQAPHPRGMELGASVEVQLRSQHLQLERRGSLGQLRGQLFSAQA